MSDAEQEMSGDEEEYEEGEEEEKEEAKSAKDKKKEEPKLKSEISQEPKVEISEAEIAMEKMRKKKEEEEAMWAEYIETRKKQKAKEEEELKKLKERQVKRKERRKEEEKKLVELIKQQEAQRVKEMEEKKSREAEEKKKRLEDAEKKRQAMQEALNRNKVQQPVTPNFVITKKDVVIPAGIDKFPSSVFMKTEMSKTKEQLAEDKRVALAVRVQPLALESLSAGELKQKVHQMWDAIVRLESEKYDLEERRKRQEYDLKELNERQRQINRSKALKKGLDADALSGKFPPMINVASKYERRLDRRSFVDKKSLFEGGYMTDVEAKNTSDWEYKQKSFKERGTKLLKWDPNKEKPTDQQKNGEDGEYQLDEEEERDEQEKDEEETEQVNGIEDEEEEEENEE